MELEQLKRELASLKAEFNNLRAAGTIPYDIYQALKTRLISSGNLRVSTNAVSSPPTEAELDSAFGDPEVLGEGFMGVVNNGGVVWLCVTISTSSWYYEQLTQA